MFDTQSEAHRKVEAELLPGEEPLWVGQPSSGLAGLRGQPLAWLGSVFGILVVMLVVGPMLFRGIRFSAVGPFLNQVSTMLLPVMIMGIVLLGMVASAVAAYLRAQKTTYAITDRRIIMLAGLLSTSVTSYGPQDIERIERRTRGQGGGDLIFRYERHARRYRSGGFSRTRYDNIPVGLFGIPNVREVEALLLETFRPDEAGSWRDADIEARTAQSLWSDPAKPKRHGLAGDALDEDDLFDLDALNADPDFFVEKLGERKPKRS